LPATVAADLRDQVRATDGLPEERLLIKAEDDAMDASVEAENKVDRAHATIVFRNSEMAVYRVLEKGYDRHYSVQQLRDRRRPQFSAFMQLCRDLIEWAEVPREANDYPDD
jgi:hypothetical protein